MLLAGRGSAWPSVGSWATPSCGIESSGGCASRARPRWRGERAVPSVSRRRLGPGAMNSIGQLWHPIWLLWWTVIGVPIHAVLKAILGFLSGNALAESIGPFGIAIVLLTILIKLVISPIFQYQLTTSRRVQAEQRRIAPQLAARSEEHTSELQS